MHAREDFVRAICERPEDDTARLVFADWLDEHGEPERAGEIRQVKVSGKGHDASRLARRLLAGAVPKSWGTWVVAGYPDIASPFDSKRRESDPPDNDSSWPYRFSNCLGMPPLTVGIRHGFISAVALSQKRAQKYLPSVVNSQPVARVAISQEFMEWEHFYRPFDTICSRHSRVVRQRHNSIPPEIWERLGPPEEPARGERDVMRAYSCLTTLYEDLGRAYLNWARGKVGLPPLASPS